VTPAHRRSLFRALSLAALSLLLAKPASAGPVVNGNTIEGTRDARYCEFLPVMRQGLHLVATAYNTLGLNDCPPALWNAIGEKAVKRQFDALTVIVNGPRYFLMDQITASGATKAGKIVEIGGLQFAERATIDVGLLDLLHRPYRETTINRETIYLFKVGRPVFMLLAPDGTHYAMQAYAQIVDKTLAYADLPALGGRLKMPSGWRYTTETPEADLVLGAKGTATVVQDELENTYQKID
jgi:hypothetical protein